MKVSYTSHFKSKNLIALMIKIIIITIISLVVLPRIIPFQLEYRKLFIQGSEVYKSIEKSSRKTTGVRTLVLGDSLGNQLYSVDRYYGEIYSLACNQAISVVGQYLLLKKYLEKNNLNGLNVYLIYHPESFSNNLDQKYTFSYFIKPFYSENKSSLFTNNVKDAVEKIPYYSFAMLPIIKMSTVSPDFDPDISFKFSQSKNGISIMKDKYFFSEISIEYLKKIYELSKKYGFKLRVVSPFLKSEFEEYAKESYRQIIIENGLEQIFAGYFDFKIISDSNFRDNYHYIYPKKFGENPLNF